MVVRRRPAAEGHYRQASTQLIGIESMTKFGAPLFARSAASQLGAVIFLALGAFVACGNDTPERPTVGHHGGAAGKTSSGGKAGKTGKGGEGNAAGDEAVMGDGGMIDPGTGGDVGMPQTGGTV